MKRLLSLALVLAVVLTMVAIPTLAETEGKIEVVLWNQIFEDWNREWCEKMAEEFNADPNQKYYITQEFIDGGAITERMTAARAAGTMPDMYLVNYSNLPKHVAEGYVMPTEDLISKEAYDDLYDNVKEMITIDGKLYGYPQMLEPAVVMYYRKDLLESVGYSEPPKTWAEFFEIAKALTNDDMFGATFSYDWSMWGWEYTAGGHWPITDDWSAANCQDEGYVALLNHIKELYEAEVVPAQALEHYNASARLVADDSVAMTFSGSWGIAAIMNDYPEMADVIGVAPAPTQDGSPFHSTVGGWTYQIDANAANPEGAAAYIEWLLGSDPARPASFFEAASFSKYSPRDSVDAYLVENTAAKDDEWMQIISSELIPNAISEPIYNWEISAFLLTAMGEVVNGATAEDALATAADEINQFIVNNNLAK